MKQILLTGGSGFIGKNIKESYFANKYKILSPSHAELDLLQEDVVTEYFKKNKIDIVIHAAVKPGHRNAKDRNDLFKSNTRMFFNLERMNEFYEKMIVLGSGAIYDMRYYRPKMSEHQYNDHIPVDDHGFCKYVCEKVIENSKNIYDLRIFGIFGKYEDYSIRFISNMICKALFNLPLTIKQNRKFSYIYIKDLMPILEYFIENESDNKSYNITPDENIFLKEIAEIVLEISGKNIPIIISNENLGSEYSGDNTLLKTTIPDIKFTPYYEAISDLYLWYSKNSNKVDVSLLETDK